MKKTEDSSFSLPSHFWSTSRSPFSTCYIPFQSSGIQESNASNCVWFGAEMRKIWPSEDNCYKLVRNSHNTSPCAKFAPAHAWCEFSSVFFDSTWDLFLCIFDLNSFLIPVISQSQALLCKDYIRGGNHLSNETDTLYILPLVKYRALFAFLFSLLFSFSWKPNNLWGCFPRGWEAKLLVSWSEGS